MVALSPGVAGFLQLARHFAGLSVWGSEFCEWTVFTLFSAVSLGRWFGFDGGERA